MMHAHILRLTVILAIAAAPLAACGKKGEPGLAAGDKSIYPHPYPSAAAAANATRDAPASPSGLDSAPPLATPADPDAKPEP